MKRRKDLINRGRKKGQEERKKKQRKEGIRKWRE